MKRALLAVLMAGIAIVAVQSPAEAAVTLALRICQGATCSTFGSASGSVTVGDYAVNASGASLESSIGSNSQTTTINVQRTGSSSALPLDVWLSASGYMLPVGPFYVLNSTHSATQTFDPSPVASTTFQAWLDTSNGVGYPPVGAVSNGVIGCTPSNTGSGTGSCNATGTPVAVAAAQPFSLTTQTTFNIAVGQGGVYGTSSQAIVTAIPEPMSIMLLGTGLLGLGGVVRRRMKK